MVACGRVAQLGEHLLCKHAFISPKSLNRRLFTVQNPLLVGLPIGLQKVNVLCAIHWMRQWLMHWPLNLCSVEGVKSSLFFRDSGQVGFGGVDALHEGP